jgi:hypothetical protein
MHIRKLKAAQTVLEYVLMISAVTASMIAMSTMVKRNAQGMVKMVADQVGVQQDAEQIDVESGYLDSMTIRKNIRDARRVQDRLGTVTYTHDGRTETQTTVLTNMGER